MKKISLFKILLATLSVSFCQLRLQALIVTNVSNAQQLQNALTLAAVDGDNNEILLASGYYIGNFNYNSSSGYNLTIEAQPAATNTQITIDGAGGGRALSIASSGAGGITVADITFSRNCGNSGIGALRIAGGGGATILVNGCQFLSPNGSTGMGLELDSGLDATVTNCTAIGPNTGAVGLGISISDVTGNVLVQNCTVNTNLSGGISVSGAGAITLDGNILTGNSGCGAYCGGANITLSSNIFIGNSYDGGYSGGGASCVSASSITLSGNTFTGNYAQDGGGASCVSASSITLSGNTFTGNSCGGDGGGANCGGGTVMLFGNTFTDNSGEYGAGAECGGTSVTLTNNIFTGNSANLTPWASGGGMCLNPPSDASVAVLINNTFISNSANGDGGGAYCQGGGVDTLSGNTFNVNSAGTGGGIYAYSSTINLLDNLIEENTGGSRGGGMWVDASATLNMINNTVTGNTAAGGGGAAFNVTGTVELLNVYNNIIWGNSASGNGGDVYLAGTGQMKVFDYNDVDSMYGVWDIAQTNIDLSPQFFNPIIGDYHIQGTSPCLAAGSTNVPSLPPTDLDGNPRILNGTVAQGCYEFTTNVFHPADTNQDWVITPTEYAAYAAAWQNGQGWSNGPSPVTANYLTRAGYLMTNNNGAYYNDGSARPVNWKTNP